jgi:hypothetical protein
MSVTSVIVLKTTVFANYFADNLCKSVEMSFSMEIYNYFAMERYCSLAHRESSIETV